MKALTLLSATALALLCGLAAQASDTVHIHIACKANERGECPPPPAPPAPPALPALPALPAPPAPPAPPEPPVLPDLPAPPAPPAVHIPAVQAAAQAACASKAPGSTLTWELRKGETMSGVCERRHGKMRFALRSYDRDD